MHVQNKMIPNFLYHIVNIKFFTYCLIVAVTFFLRQMCGFQFLWDPALSMWKMSEYLPHAGGISPCISQDPIKQRIILTPSEGMKMTYIYDIVWFL